jgi:hypothetical protein
MMKKVLVVMLVLGLASAANAAMTAASQIGPEGIMESEVGTVLIGNDADGPYAGWLEIADPTVAMFAADPQVGLAFTQGGNPNGDSTSTYWPEFGEWYDFTVVSLDPEVLVMAGDHISVEVLGVAEGDTVMRLYLDDGATQVGDDIPIKVIPEPITIALLGVGGLFLRRRR